VVQSQIGGETLVVYPRGLYWDQYCSSNIFINDLDKGTVHPQQVHRYKTGSDWYTRWLCCHSGGPGKAGELGW